MSQVIIDCLEKRIEGLLKTIDELKHGHDRLKDAYENLNDVHNKSVDEAVKLNAKINSQRMYIDSIKEYANDNIGTLIAEAVNGEIIKKYNDLTVKVSEQHEEIENLNKIIFIKEKHITELAFENKTISAIKPKLENHKKAIKQLTKAYERVKQNLITTREHHREYKRKVQNNNTIKVLPEFQGKGHDDYCNVSGAKLGKDNDKVDCENKCWHCEGEGTVKMYRPRCVLGSPYLEVDERCIFCNGIGKTNEPM
jgi:archaellum component FlaC